MKILSISSLRSLLRYPSISINVIALYTIGAYLFLSFEKTSRRLDIRLIERVLRAFDLSREPFLSTDMIASVILPSFC